MPRFAASAEFTHATIFSRSYSLYCGHRQIPRKKSRISEPKIKVACTKVITCYSLYNLQGIHLKGISVKNRLGRAAISLQYPSKQDVTIYKKAIEYLDMSKLL